MEEKLGIDNLKIAIIAAITFGENIESKLVDDGKISLAEALSVGANSFGSIVKILKSGTQIRDEFNDLDDEEKAELIALIQLELDLVNDKVEFIIEKAIEFLLSLEGLIQIVKTIKSEDIEAEEETEAEGE